MNKARILVIEDNRSLVRLYESILTRKGYDVLAAFNGEEGLQKAREEKPDLIILDIIMPKMDGYEVCRHLRRDPATAAIPVLMLTRKGSLDDSGSSGAQWSYDPHVQERLEGFRVEAHDFVTKPVAAKELLKRVKALLLDW